MAGSSAKESNGHSSTVTQRINGQELEAVPHAQAAIVDDYQKVFDRWCARRHQSSQEFALLAQALLEGGKPQDVMNAWSKWSKGAMQRLADDARDQLEVGASLARNFGNGALAAMLIPAEHGATILTGSSDPEPKVANGSVETMEDGET